MVNPDDLIQNVKRTTLEQFEKGTLKDEARDGVVKQRFFKPDVVERKVEEVYLPILLIPGVASSGLFVEKSGLDEKYEGRRVWVNPTFLAAGRMGNTILNEDELHNNDDKDETTFAKAEDECAIKNAWIYHIAMSENMMDEKPGNRIRTRDGLPGCEYLSDSLAKDPSYVFGPLVDYCVNTMGYEREKNLDAMPYDWRLAPSITEKRDGYLTKVIQRIERMHDENDNLPIVLVCHSMGCKMGHYFLNFAKKHKGQNWLDKYIHTYMPVAAPHLGVGLAVRTGLMGVGLNDLVDTLVGNTEDGLHMYRTWSCGNWLMPRMLPEGVFPVCIARREGELGVTLTSEIEVGRLFRKREKPPKELRLTIIFRDTMAHTDFSPVIHNKDGTNPKSMKISFNETFYIAVPNLGTSDEMGELTFYLEEPGGRINQNKSKIQQFFSDATSCLRPFKKMVTVFFRRFAKTIGTTLRVASCDRPLKLRVSEFKEELSAQSTNVRKQFLDKIVTIRGCVGGKDARNAIGNVSLKLSYSHPPKSTGTKVSETPIAMINDKTPIPPIMSHDITDLTENVVYDVMNGVDMYKADGFVESMFDLVKNVFEGDPIGPTTKSAHDAPPVNCVRSIYGVNVKTEVGAIYRKEPVVTIGDNRADRRYMLDDTANFRPTKKLLSSEAWSELNFLAYKIQGGKVYETPNTLQKVPGQTEERRVCGDGTVPYWNMVHALTWKDKVETLTVDELDGAVHRDILADERFFALLKRYSKVIDPRANAMMKMKSQLVDATAGGIGTLGHSIDDISDS